MLRDADPRALLDRRSDQPSGGPELPRSGRSGGSAGPLRPRISEDVRDVFARGLDLPRGAERELVRLGRGNLSLRGSEVRTLALIGAFRVVDIRDLQTPHDRWHGDLEHLRQHRLVTLTPQVLDGERTALATLTARGRALIESHRDRGGTEPAQTYYAGLAKPREATHDAQLARVYAAASEHLAARGARIQRVLLDYELKREYQRFLQERNRGNARSSGRPDRSREEVRAWAAAHGLPVVRDRVQFPDVRIEYEHPDGRRDREDLELATGHYTSRQMAAKRASGFTVHRSTAGRLTGSKSRRGTSPFDPRTAEAVLR
jgi:hypothetical protein